MALLYGGLVLLVLIAGIASLVTRQVVVPVRQAAEVDERFAHGHLSERMPVVGEDDMARLGTSFNEMAASLQRQIRQLEEFGELQRGFTSDVTPGLEGQGFVLHESTCPFYAVVQDRPEICDMEQRMMSRVLNADVQLSTCLLEGHHGCQFKVVPRERANV